MVSPYITSRHRVSSCRNNSPDPVVQEVVQSYRVGKSLVEQLFYHSIYSLTLEYQQQDQSHLFRLPGPTHSFHTKTHLENVVYSLGTWDTIWNNTLHSRSMPEPCSLLVSVGKLEGTSLPAKNQCCVPHHTPYISHIELLHLQRFSAALYPANKRNFSAGHFSRMIFWSVARARMYTRIYYIYTCTYCVRYRDRAI